MNIKPNHALDILVATNGIIFLLQNLVNSDAWLLWGALWRLDSPYHHVWQWFTHLFLHGSLPHLLFNMATLVSFAAALLRFVSVKWFLWLYFVSGLVGAAVFMPFMPSDVPMLGASGAVFGVLAAFAVCFPNERISLMFVPIYFRAKYCVPVMVAYEIFAQLSGISLFGANIAHMAHVGGAASGLVFGLVWRKDFR